MNLVLFADGPWGAVALKHLQARHNIALVVGRVAPTDDSLFRAVQEAHLPFRQPPDCNSGEFLREIRDLNPRLCLSVSYDQIIRRPLRRVPELGFVNIHAAPLPYYRGRAAVIWQLINGESSVGLTAHFLSGAVDRGPILLQRHIAVEPLDHYGDVLFRITSVLPEFLDSLLERLVAGERGFQQETTGGSYFPRRRSGDELVNWHQGSRVVFDFLRALAPPGPLALTHLEDGTALRIVRAAPAPEFPRKLGIPGSIVGKDRQGNLVKTADGAVRLLEVLLQGERRIPDLPLGTRFMDPREQRLQMLEKRLLLLENRILQTRTTEGSWQ